MKKVKLIILFLLLSFTCFAQTLSTTIHFVVNTDRIVEDSNYLYYVNEIIPTIENNSQNIECILFIGSASPEGNKDINMKLAEKRANKAYSYMSDFVPASKILKTNNYALFLEKTHLREDDYTKLRATYIEVIFKEKQRDVIYIEKHDTLYKETVYNYYKETVVNTTHNKPIISIYNDLLSDLLFRANVGSEIYFNKLSLFIEGSFSNWQLVGKTYNIDVWHTGFRKYFNNNYDKLFLELYANAGYFDTNLLNENGKIGALYGGGIGVGYAFSLCPHWKICPTMRIGLFEKIYYADYYYSENGSINISFDNYVNGKINNAPTNSSTISNNVVTTSKTITKEFIENSNKAYYIGPTYVGITLKRDFCINNKHK